MHQIFHRVNEAYTYKIEEHSLSIGNHPIPKSHRLPFRCAQEALGRYKHLMYTQKRIARPYTKQSMALTGSPLPLLHSLL